MKTVYEIALEYHHELCGIAEKDLRDYGHLESKCLREIEQEAIDRCYIIGLMIDSMPVELAEKRV